MTRCNQGFQDKLLIICMIRKYYYIKSDGYQSIEFSGFTKVISIILDAKARGFVSEVRHVYGDAPQGVSFTRY